MKKLDDCKTKFNPAQLTGLEQRMSLLMSFLETDEVRKKFKDQARFEAGQLTIVDLSDPFLDEGAACGIFDIITRLFVRADVKTGKVLVVDEAHKASATCSADFALHVLIPTQYLAATGRSAHTGLTKSLTRIIRQQRHLSMRVLISTQGTLNHSRIPSSLTTSRRADGSSRCASGSLFSHHSPSLYLALLVGTFDQARIRRFFQERCVR